MPENKGVQYKIVINGRESIKEVPADKVSIFEKNAKAKGYTYKKIEPAPAPKPAPAPVSPQEQVSNPDSNNNATKELKLGNIPQQDSLPNSALYNAPSPIKKVVYDNSINPSFGNAPKKTIQDFNKTQNKEYSPAPIEPQKQGQTFSESLKENQERINPTPQREYSNENMATIQAGEIINPNEPLHQEMVTNNPEVLKTEQEYERTKGKFMGAGSEIKAKQAYEKAKDDAYNAYISKKNEDNNQDDTQGNGQRKEHIQAPSYNKIEVDGEIKYIPKGSAFDTDADNATEWNSRVARNVENKEIVAENTRQEFETTLADDSIADNKKRDRLRQLAGNIYANQAKRLEKLYNTGQINDATKSYLMNKSARAYKQLQNDGNYTLGNAFTTDRIINIGTAGAYGLVKSVADVLAYGDIDGNDRKVYSDVVDMFTNADEKTRDNSYAYDVVSGALESIPYMTQMGYSFGVGTALQASTKATSKGVAKYLLSRGLSKGALKSTNIIAKGIVNATVFAAISPETYKGVIEDGREQFGADFTFNDITGGMILRNFAQSSMTAVIERSGSLMNKLVPKQFVTNLQAQTPQVIRKVISSTGALQGIVPEFIEEKLEELSNIVVWNEGTWEQFFNPQQNLVTLGVCGLLQSPTIAAQTNNIARNKYKSSRNIGIVSAYDKRIAEKLKEASRIENPDERMKAYASSGITSIQSIEGQKAAVAYVLHSEAVINQRLLIREEMGENVKHQITLNITRVGLSYKNSEGRDVVHQAITTDNNGVQRMFYVLGGSVGGLVPVKEVIDGNISPKKTFVSEKLFESSEQIVDDVLNFIDQAALRLTEQEKARFAEEDYKAEAMDTKIEQENAQAMQNVVNDVQEEEASVLASLEDNEIRQGTIVYDKYDTKEEKTELEVISVDGEQAEVRLENGKTVLLPVEELGVVMQTTPNAQELAMQAIEESTSETAPETGQEATSETTPETAQETTPEEVDIYAGFPRTKQGEVDINKLSPEQVIIYAENELGKEFAIKQVQQTHDALTARRDSLIKKMAKQSIKEAIKTKKQIDSLDAEIDTYSIYLNDNNVLGVIPQEDLNTKTKTKEERLAYVDEVAEATPRGYLLRGIATGEFKFVWGGDRGVASELGFFLKNKRNKKGEKVSSAGEMRSRIGILSNKGFTPDTLGEYLADRFEGMIDALDARSLVIEVLNEVTNQREALEALENSFVERDDYMRRYEEEESERIALEEAEREELEITIKAYYESNYNGFLKELDEEHAKIAEYAVQNNVPQELIENAYSTFDLLTIIEEYGNNEQENNNERGSDASNGISSSEREISERDRGGIKEAELDSRRDTISESETKSDSENGLQEVQGDNTEKGIDYDNNREQGLNKVSGEEQSREANEVLEQSEPQTSGGLDRSRRTESQAPVSESNIQGSTNALSSEATSQETDNARSDRETKAKSTTESNTNDDLLHFSSEEVQVIDNLNEFVSKNKFTTKARFIHSNSKEFAEKTKRIPENNKKGVTGWYNQSTNEVVIVLDNLTGDKQNEAKKTYLHEVIGHQSLYNALGKEAHTELMNDIYNVIPKIYKAKFNKDNGQSFKEQLLEEGVSPENLDAEYNKRVDEIIAKQVESELAQYNGNITEYADEFFAYNAENINLDQDTKKSFIDTIKNFIERIFGIHSNDDYIQGLIDTAINYNINQDKIEAQKKVDRFKALVETKEKTKTELHNLNPTTNLDSLEKNIAKILEGYSGREMASIQVEEYMKEFRDISKEYLDKYNLSTREELQAHLAKLQTKLREGKGKERMQAKEQARVDKMINEISEMAATAQAEMEREIEDFGEDIGGTKKQKPFSDYSINKDAKNDIRFRNIESIKDRNRQVLRIDEYGKNIVWENGDYYIAVDSKDDARYISLWSDNKKIGFLSAQKGIDRIDGISPNDVLLVSNVEIDKKHRGNGLSKPMYKALIDFSANNIKAIASYLPDRVNKKQVPEIWNSFGVETEDDYDYIRFREKQIKSEAIANGTFMKAPNGKPSNLTEKQWLQVRTPEFKSWFGDWENSPETASKVIDENGEPLVVYHGSPNGEISTFDWNNGNGKLLNRGALYFSPYSNVGKNYAGKSASAKVYPVFLNVKNIKELNDYISIGTINTEIAKQINENGFDGAHYKPTNEDINNPRSSLSKENEEYVAFFPNQIKSATDNNGEFNSENTDIRYREVPTNKNFVALHNIPEWKLARVLKQGGFVNPSVAVTIPEIAPFESYGEISFVAPKRLIDKKTGKNAGTFLGDAYTPRYPHIDYDISSKKKEELRKRIFKNELLNKYNLQSDVSNRIIDGIEQKGGDEIALSNEVKMLFLAEKGIDFIKLGERIYTDKEIDNLSKLGYAKKEIFEIKDNEEDKKLLTELWEVKNKERYGDEFEDAKQRLYVDGYLPILIMRGMLNEIKSEIKNPLKVSFYDNLDNAQKYVNDNNLNQEAEKFAYDLYNSLDVKELIFDGFTPTGRRRYLANSIENASKVMNKQGLEGAEVIFGGGLGKLRALIAPKLTSTDKIAKFRSLIVSEDEFETIKVNLEDVYDDISDKLAGKDGGWDTGITRLAEVINLSNPSEYLNKEYDLEISDELNNQIKEFRTQLLSMPTEYFETKFQRPVYVAEFSGVLIPSNASEEVKAALNRIGIKVKEYSEDTERQTKLNELIDDLEASEQIRFRNNKQFQDEQSSIQKIGGKEYPHIDNIEIDDIRFRLGKKSRANYEDILIKKRKDLTEEGRSTFLDYLDTIDDKKKEKIIFKWFAQGSVILPEDTPKIEQAIKVAEVKKIDPMQYDSPMKLIEEHADVELKDEKINPDSVRTLSSKVDYGNGITVYDVEESEQGREDMRNIINTHFGKNRSPWCLLQGNENGELTSQSKDYWKHYNKITKRVAFLDGKLLSFSANDKRDVIWWDKTDNSHKGIPITRRIPNDELKRTGTILFDEETKQLGKPFDLFKGDKINGVYETWHDNGQLWKRVNYKDGKRDGLYEWWHENGVLMERINYKNGELNGLHERWSKDGQLRERTNYKDGEPNGLYEMWNSSGQLKKRGNYKGWRKEGLHEEWYDNGQPKERSNYKDGNKDGLYEWWIKEGQLRERTNYKDGEMHGLHELWYDNGQLWERRNYKDGKLNGLYEEFDKNGKLTYSVIYSNNVSIKDNLKEDEGIRYRLREKPAPKNTIKAYKLFRTDNKGNLYTLFIDNNVPLKIGSWYDADSPQMDILSKLPHTEGEKEIYLINKDNTFELWSGNTKLPKINEVNNASISQARYIQVSDGKNGRMYHNVGINGANGVSLYAMRAGLHSTNVPTAHHIGKGRAGAKAVNRPDNQVWAEIEVSADVNYQDEALSNAPIVTSKSSANYGKPNMAMAQITDKIPIDGYYIYRTNANANKAQDWIISGAMKINKVLDDNTTKKIARDLGFDEDLPRVQEKVNRFNELLNGESNNRYHTINIDGVERPTVNSLGKPIASTEEGLRNFWKWFGDSKVVDSEGLPLVVYHGTKAKFSSFDTDKQLIGWLGRGFYFSTNKDEARDYGKLIKVYLRLQNPFIVKGDIVDKNGNVEFAGNVEGQIQSTYETFDYTEPDISKILKENNHDGVMRDEMISVFSPTQIKSIDNAGTFDPENEDIRFRWKDVYDDSEIDKYKNRYNGKIFEIEDDKILITKYSVIEDSPTYMYAIEDAYSFKDALYTAQGYNADADNDYTRVIIRVNSGHIPLVEFKEYTKENSADFEEYDGTIDDYVEQYLEDYLRYNDIEEDGSEETLDIQESEYDNTETDDLIEEVKEKINDRLGVSVRKYSHFYVNRDGKITEDYEDEQGNENIEVTMRLADHTHNPLNGNNDLNIVISDNDKTGSRYWYARTDMEFDSTYTADEIVDEIEDYWREFASENYDSEEIRFRRRKEAQEEVDLFNDLLNPEESNTKKAISKLEANKDKINELGKKFEINYFNKIKPLDEINKIIAKEDLYKRYDVYRETSNYISRVHAKSEKFNETLGQRYIESMAKIKEKTGFSYEEIGDYHMAIYMPEYTAKILQSKIDNDSYITNWQSELDTLKENDSGDTSKKEKYLQNKIGERINVIKEKYKDGLAGEKGFAEDLKKRGFGFTTPEEYVEYFENIVDDNAVIEELKASLRDINQFSLRVGHETGQISKEQYEGFRSNPNYVPLRGWSETFDDSGEANPFQMLNITGKGRESKASNPINYIFAQAYTVINFGEINDVKRKLAKLALMNSSNEAFKELFGYNEMYEGNLLNEEGEVKPFRAYSKEEYEQLQGVIEDGLIIRRSKEKYDNKQRQINPHKHSEEYQKHILVFYDKGIRHELYIEDKGIVESFKSDSVSQAFAKFRKLTSMMTRLMTSRNLSFIVPNLIRDLGATLVLNNYSNNSKGDIKFKKELLQNMAKYTPIVWKGIWNHDWDSQAMELYNNWELDGGKTGWLQTFKSIDDLGKDIEKRLNKNNKEKILMDLVKLKPIENLAEFSESIIRFATYVTALNNGYTRADAAFMSNDVSLNYNLKGKKGNWLKSIYGLFNAAVAGTYKVYNFAKANPKQFAAATFGLMLAGYGQWWLSELLDDDKDKRSEYRSQRMISLFGISIPMSYDLVPIFRAGYLIAEYIHGDKMSDTEFAYELMMSPTEIVPEQVQSAFSFLVNYDEDIDRLRYLNWEYLSELSPTILSPITDVVVNRDFMGRDIVKESKFLDIPNSANYDEYKVTNFDKLAAFVVNGIDQFDWRNHDERSRFTSKGDERIIDVSPAHVNHILRGYLSGVYQTFVGTIEAVDMLTDDKPNDANKLAGKLPVINRFYIGTNENIPVYKTIEVLDRRFGAITERATETRRLARDKSLSESEREKYREEFYKIVNTPEFEKARIYEREKREIFSLMRSIRFAANLEDKEKENKLRQQLSVKLLEFKN